MTLDELRLLYSAGKTFYLYDVRSAKEFAVSHLKGAVRLEDAGKVAVPKDSLIVVYCSVGVRSAALVHQLSRLGFTEAYNLEGSIFGWANRQLPLYVGDRKVHVVHPYNSRWGVLLDKQLHSYKPGPEP
jgi:rhodanese-related sulfurtransferase